MRPRASLLSARVRLLNTTPKKYLQNSRSEMSLEDLRQTDPLHLVALSYSLLFWMKMLDWMDSWLGGPLSLRIFSLYILAMAEMKHWRRSRMWPTPRERSRPSTGSFHSGDREDVHDALLLPSVGRQTQHKHETTTKRRPRSSFPRQPASVLDAYLVRVDKTRWRIASRSQCVRTSMVLNTDFTSLLVCGPAVPG